MNVRRVVLVLYLQCIVGACKCIDVVEDSYRLPVELVDLDLSQ